MYDLLLKGGTVIDPGQGWEGILDVAISGGLIAAVAEGIPESAAARVLDVAGKLVLPGLIDNHAHIYWGATIIGSDADEVCLPHGVTTVVDCGSCGSDNFEGFKRWIAEAARTRVYCFVHLSSLGLTACRRAGELANPAYADPRGALDILRRYPDLVLGLKLRAAETDVGGPCLPMLRLSRQVADEAGVPLVVHVGNSVEPVGEILPWLKAGDVVAHCGTGLRNGLLDREGHVFPSVWEARERGVFFDVAHGRFHFSFQAAGRLLDQGFAPDILSTDLSQADMPGLVYDLPTVMTKFWMLGMPLAEAVRTVTHNPARALHKTEQLGSLKPGVAADVAVLQWEEGEFPMMDCMGETRAAPRRLAPWRTILRGETILD